MKETAGNGVGRLLEATGSTPMINNCFSLLRYLKSSQQDIIFCVTLCVCVFIFACAGKVVKLD